MSDIRVVSETFMKQIASTKAHFIYDGAYYTRGLSSKENRAVLKAKDVTPFDYCVAKMKEYGYKIPTVGELNPFKSIKKHHEYGVNLGSSLSYVRMQENKLKREGYEGAKYTPKWRAPHRFPLYGELIYLSLDFQTIYFGAYPANDDKVKPAAEWLVDGRESTKYEFLPWAEAKDFKLWTTGELTKSHFNDGTNNLIGKSGNEIALREYMEVKLENCQLIINGEDIRDKMFEKVTFYSDEQLIRMRDAYLEKKEKEFEKRLAEWELSQKG